MVWVSVIYLHEKAMKSALGEFDSYNEYRKVWRNQPHIQRRHRNTDLIARYGITIDEYDRMLAQQNGGCKICKRKDTGVKNQKYFHVDHDPRSGHVRGLLCKNCNTGLGAFAHAPEFLHEAAKYIVENEEFTDEH